MKFDELTKIAHDNLKPKELSEYVAVGELSCALLIDKEIAYIGVNIDVVGSIGICAEHSAIASMINNGKHIL